MNKTKVSLVLILSILLIPGLMGKLYDHGSNPEDQIYPQDTIIVRADSDLYFMVRGSIYLPSNFVNDFDMSEIHGKGIFIHSTAVELKIYFPKFVIDYSIISVESNVWYDINYEVDELGRVPSGLIETENYNMIVFIVWSY